MRNDKRLRNTYWFRTALGCCLGVLLILTLYWPSGVGTGLAQHGSATKTIPFYITLDGEAEQTIATSGPLKFIARCTLSNPGSPGEATVHVVATSTENGWFYSAGGLLGPFNAGFEDNVFSASAPIGTAQIIQGGNSVILINDSFCLTIDAETLGLGVNIFGHDCVVVGTVSSARRTP
jgi:hypothetical protein